VASIMAALKAHNDIGAAGEPIDDLAFALIAPLGTDHCYICHVDFLSRRESARASLKKRLHRRSKTDVPDSAIVKRG
jgi:hypothetical protein